MRGWNTSCWRTDQVFFLSEVSRFPANEETEAQPCSLLHHGMLYHRVNFSSVFHNTIFLRDTLSFFKKHFFFFWKQNHGTFNRFASGNTCCVIHTDWSRLISISWSRVTHRFQIANSSFFVCFAKSPLPRKAIGLARWPAFHLLLATGDRQVLPCYVRRSSELVNNTYILEFNKISSWCLCDVLARTYCWSFPELVSKWEDTMSALCYRNHGLI